MAYPWDRMVQDAKYKEFGARLRELRRKAKLTQARLAEEADISCVYVNKLERGLSVPSLEVLGRLAKSLDTDASSLLGERREGTQSTTEPTTSPYMNLYLTGDKGAARRLVYSSDPPIPTLPSAEAKKKR